MCTLRSKPSWTATLGQQGQHSRVLGPGQSSRCSKGSGSNGSGRKPRRSSINCRPLQQVGLMRLPWLQLRQHRRGQQAGRLQPGLDSGAGLQRCWLPQMSLIAMQVASVRKQRREQRLQRARSKRQSCHQLRLLLV